MLPEERILCQRKDSGISGFQVQGRWRTTSEENTRSHVSEMPFLSERPDSATKKTLVPKPQNPDPRIETFFKVKFIKIKHNAVV